MLKSKNKWRFDLTNEEVGKSATACKALNHLGLLFSRLKERGQTTVEDDKLLTRMTLRL